MSMIHPALLYSIGSVNILRDFVQLSPEQQEAEMETALEEFEIVWAANSNEAAKLAKDLHKQIFVLIEILKDTPAESAFVWGSYLWKVREKVTKAADALRTPNQSRDMERRYMAQLLKRLADLDQKVWRSQIIYTDNIPGSSLNDAMDVLEKHKLIEKIKDGHDVAYKITDKGYCYRQTKEFSSLLRD